MKASLIIILVAIALACATPRVAPVNVEISEVRDDLGRTVKVPKKIDRAISLAPSITEMVFAIGAGEKLVGVTTYCNYPPDATKIEKVGDTQTPNVERIIALKPQIVLVSTASQLEAFSKTLDEQDIAVYVIDSRSLDEVFDDMRRLGELFGTSASTENLVGALNTRAIRVQQKVKKDHQDRVFLQISNEPLFTIGKESFLTELIEKAGGVSTTKDVATAYPKLSKETAAALDPDVLILSDSEDNREPNTVFKNSEAVKNGRVYRINADIISRPGPRLVDALEEISAKLQEKY